MVVSCGGTLPRCLEVVGQHLVEVGDDVFVRDHHTGRLTSRAGRVLQICSLGQGTDIRGGQAAANRNPAHRSRSPRARIRRAERRYTDITSSTTADVVSIATGEQSRSAPDTRSSSTPNCGTGQRDGDKTSLHRAEEGDDVIQALRSQYRCPITNRAANAKFLRDDSCSLIDLRPRQALRKPSGSTS